MCAVQCAAPLCDPPYPPTHPYALSTHSPLRPSPPPRRYEVDKLTASQRLDLNLEKGRMRDELQMLRDKANELEIKVRCGVKCGMRRRRRA